MKVENKGTVINLNKEEVDMLVKILDMTIETLGCPGTHPLEDSYILGFAKELNQAL